MEPTLKTNTYERGTYYFFDCLNWRKVAKVKPCLIFFSSISKIVTFVKLLTFVNDSFFHDRVKTMFASLGVSSGVR